jgi:alcohol dehydrogenase class IV
MPGNIDAAVNSLVRRLDELLVCAGIPKNLGALGISEKDINALADNAEQQWTGSFNPRPVKAAEFCVLYQSALAGQA